MTQVFLEVKMTQITILQAQHGESVTVQMANYDILETWVQNNPGPSARKRLWTAVTGIEQTTDIKRCLSMLTQVK